MSEDTVLAGMKDICKFMKRSESTILKLKRMYPDFPMSKVGGVWSSDKVMLAAWNRKMVELGIAV